ncbi:MAG: sulfotransferase [bacterium]
MSQSQSYHLELSAPQLMARAREIVGVDIVDEIAIEAVERLVKSLNEEAQLTQDGARVAQDNVLRTLCNRLRMFRDFRDHPEIADQPLKDPIFLIGMVRTGSTKTQKLLAASEDFNYLTYWQSMNFASYSGEPNESVDARIADIQAYEDWYDQVAPHAKLGHALETHGVEEESYILMSSLYNGGYYGFYHIPSFLEWVAQQSHLIEEEFLRDVLKYLQWQGLADPNKRWMLKSPMHNGAEVALREVFPDASLVMTHRDLTSVVPSACKLNAALKSAFSKRPIDVDSLCGGIAWQMSNHMQFRKAHPEENILDVYYMEVIEDIPAAMKKIYDFCNAELTSDSLQRILDWDNNNPKNKHGEFKYSLEEYGLDKDDLRKQYPEYFQFLLDTFPDRF